VGLVASIGHSSGDSPPATYGVIKVRGLPAWFICTGPYHISRSRPERKIGYSPTGRGAVFRRDVSRWACAQARTEFEVAACERPA